MAAKRFTEETGLPVEQICRVIWPAPGLADLVSRWLERYEPEMVVIHTNSYWFTYASVPAKMGRLFGAPGRAAASLGLRAADRPALAQNAVFRTGRKLVVRTVGGDVAIKAVACVEMMDEMVRRIVAQRLTKPFQTAWSESVAGFMSRTGNARSRPGAERTAMTC